MVPQTFMSPTRHTLPPFLKVKIACYKKFMDPGVITIYYLNEQNKVPAISAEPEASITRPIPLPSVSRRTGLNFLLEK